MLKNIYFYELYHVIIKMNGLYLQELKQQVYGQLRLL
jgi:hypothetical protein